MNNRIDRGEIYKWFDTFVAWKEKPLVEIRVGARNNAWYSGIFMDPDSIIENIEKYESYGIYFTVNSLRDECRSLNQFNKILEHPAKAISDNDIRCRDWILIDIDPKRMAGINATDEESKYAKEVARKVARYLRQEGLGQPIVTFSGNGIHLFYRTQALNNDENKKLIENFLRALASIFDDDKVSIDTNVANPSRIAKLPGTMSAKGRSDDTERPQRMCRILTVPTEVVPTDIAYFAKVASLVPEPIKPSRENDWGRKKFDLQEFIRKHGIGVKQEVRAAGGTRYILDHCVFNPDHKAKDAMIFQYDDGTIAYKCLHASCSQYKWRDVRLLYEPDAYSSREDFFEFAYKRKMQGQDKPYVPQPETAEKGPKWLSLDEIPTLNPDEIVSIGTGIDTLDKKIFNGTILGQLSIMTGRPASGKSTLLNTILLSSVNQGYPTAIFSGELPNFLLKSWITLPAAGRGNVRASQKIEGAYYVPADVERQILAWLKGKLFVHNADYGNRWEQLKADILEIVKRGAKNIIIDNLMTVYLEHTDYTKNAAQIDFVSDLHRMVQQENIHIWLVAHPRKQINFLRFEDISGASEMGNLADNTFIVHRVNRDFENQAKNFFPRDKVASILDAGYTNVIEIAKNRSPGLHIGELVGVYYEPETKRMKYSTEDNKQYGWDTTPAPSKSPDTSDFQQELWYNKEQDREVKF